MAVEYLPGLNNAEWQDFWKAQQEEMFAIIAPYAEASALMGAATGADAIAHGWSDWNLVHEWARGWAWNYSYDLVKGITEESASKLQSAVGDWIDSGLHLDWLENDLVSDFGPIRAQMIASTEVTRAFTKGNLWTWGQAPDVIASQWFTAEDELVCKVCGGLADQSAQLNQMYAFDGSHGAMQVDGPPAHVRCRCSLRPVTRHGITQGARPEKPVVPDEEAPLGPFTRISGDPRNTTAADYAKAREHFHNKPEWVNRTAGEQKDAICKEISRRTGFGYDTVNETIHQWAWTSNDNSYASLELQKAAAKITHTDLSAWQKGKLQEVLDGGRQRSCFEIEVGKLRPDVINMGCKTSEEAAERFVKEVYGWTQEELKAADITHVHLYRGVSDVSLDDRRILDQARKMHTAVNFNSNTMESWSLSASVSERPVFCNSEGVLFEADIPADRVIGSFRTGWGCMEEDELVILGNIPGDMLYIKNIHGLR